MIIATPRTDLLLSPGHLRAFRQNLIFTTDVCYIFVLDWTPKQIDIPLDATNSLSNLG